MRTGVADPGDEVDVAPESIVGHEKSIGRRAIASKCARDLRVRLKCFASLPKTRAPQRLSPVTHMTRRALFEPTPIPGTGPLCRGLFVSRAFGLFDKRSQGRALRFDPALFSKGAVAALFSAGQSGWKIYLIGNEESVARGRTSPAAWERFETALLAHLKGQGVPIVRHYACVDHPQGTGAHKRDSVFLFPNTGALYHAAQEDGIVLSESWLVSGDALELAAGWRAACRTAALDPSLKLRSGRIEVETSARTQSLAEVLRQIVATGDLARR